MYFITMFQLVTLTGVLDYPFFVFVVIDNCFFFFFVSLLRSSKFFSVSFKEKVEIKLRSHSTYTLKLTFVTQVSV